MLARNAESLYWIGRYVERADNVARILDVAVQQILEDVTLNRDASARFLFNVLGITPASNMRDYDAFALTEAVAYNRDYASGSIYDAIGRARENARGAREMISTEVWECLNTTYNTLPEKENLARRLGPHSFFSYVENQAAMFNGLVDSTLSRSDGYRFLILGRSLERVDMTIRMLMSRAGDKDDAPLWLSVLRSAGAQDTFLRAYRGRLSAKRVVEFMLLDRLFPRSVFYSLTIAESCLRALNLRPGYSTGIQAIAQREIGRARSELEFLDKDIIVDDLSQRLINLQDTCRIVNEAIRNQYFHISPYVEWTDARAREMVIEEEETTV